MLQRVLPFLERLGRRKATAMPIEERRVWVRHPCRLETTLQAGDADERAPISARVRNVSRGGIQLIVDRCIQTGELIGVDLPGPDEGAVLACVLHTAKAGSREWALNCSFAAELGDDELRLFSAASSSSADAEQRASVRYPCKSRVVYQVVGGDALQRGFATVLNLSSGGAALSVAHPLAVGTLLDLSLRDEEDRLVASMLASVVRVRPA